MAEIATVKINGGEGEPEFIIINAEDFQEGVHELYVERDPVVGRQLGAGAGEAEADPAAELMKLTKQELIAKAAELSIDIVPDESTKQQIVDKILGK